MTASETFTGSNPKWFKNLRTFGEIGITYNNQKIKGKLDNRGFPCMFIGYTEDHASNVDVFFNLHNQAIFMSRNVVWLHKLFYQHMKTKSASIPGFTAYDVTPAITNNQPVPLAVAPTIAPACATTSRIFNPPTISSPSTNEDSDDDDGTPIPPTTPHAPFDMTDTNAPLTPRLPRELRNLETFYNPQPGDSKGNIALLTHDNDTCEDKMLAYPYKESDTDIINISDDVEFCNAHLPEYDSNSQSAAQALLSKKSKHWWKAMITEFLNCEEKKAWVIVPKSKVLTRFRPFFGNFRRFLDDFTRFHF
jgi:hypothetical protein